MWSWLPHHHYHAITTMATTTMKPKHQCHSAITTPPNPRLRPLSQAQRRRRLPQPRRLRATTTTTRSIRRCSTKGTGRVDSPAVLFPYFVHQAHHTSSMVERRPEARPRSACGRGFRPVFGRSRLGSLLDFLRSKTRKDSFLCHVFSDLFLKD